MGRSRDQVMADWRFGEGQNAQERDEIEMAHRLGLSEEYARRQRWRRLIEEEWQIRHYKLRKRAAETDDAARHPGIA